MKKNGVRAGDRSVENKAEMFRCGGCENAVADRPRKDHVQGGKCTSAPPFSIRGRNRRLSLDPGRQGIGWIPVLRILGSKEAIVQITRNADQDKAHPRDRLAGTRQQYQRLFACSS